jgi:hypothetical protein
MHEIDRDGKRKHACPVAHIDAVVSDKGVWLPCQLLKELGPCHAMPRPALLFLEEKTRGGGSTWAWCVW